MLTTKLKIRETEKVHYGKQKSAKGAKAGHDEDGEQKCRRGWHIVSGDRSRSTDPVCYLYCSVHMNAGATNQARTGMWWFG